MQIPLQFGTLIYNFLSLPRSVIPQHSFAGSAGLFRFVYLADVCLTQRRDLRAPLDDRSRDFRDARDVRDFRDFRDVRDVRDFRDFRDVRDFLAPDRPLDRDFDLVGIALPVFFPYGPHIFLVGPSTNGGERNESSSNRDRGTRGDRLCEKSALFERRALGREASRKTEKMDIEWLAAAMRDANSLLWGSSKAVVVCEPALVRRHRGVRGLDGDLVGVHEGRAVETGRPAAWS